ncbi:class I SAM-dependent methyltransferase [Algoriphagus sediminis]|uniref:Class I SAM-dependent methyltransferase n=1 Tax=Algoriphagus sediminis TaxID=3057113 RepID=A0ABT7YCC0_9BACT|nr:class I SAM-dependent methyltransferase [Algoriphagus sediminis]MDN3204147.1 class I SAM-dependent methyltransferase [Algoriphagus sediminis]
MMFGLNDSFLYSHCHNCGSIWIDNVPENLDKFYPPSYYSFDKSGEENALKKNLKKWRFKMHKKGFSFKPPQYFDWIDRLELDVDDSIADIGCGDGILLKQLKYCGFENLLGFDPFIGNETILNGLKIKKLPFEEISGFFDCIMFHHSFEHLEDPLRVFEKIAQILKPDGKALIRTPVSGSLVWEEEKENWFQLDAPRHLFIPSVKGMQILAQNSGLELFLVLFDSLDTQFSITELYKRGIPLVKQNPQKEFSKRELNSFVKRAEKVNRIRRGDQAAFYFRKL